MKEKIIVVGLGPGSPEQLSLGAWKAIKNAGKLLLQTARHPVVQWLDSKGIRYDSYDRYSKQRFSREELESFIVNSVVEESSRAPVVFAVPGHPLMGDRIVQKILKAAKEKEISVRVVSGVSFDNGGTSYPLDPIVEVMARLRARDGCPWDREQDHFSLTPYLLEETYEVLDALEQGDMYKFCEELGDLLLQIVFHAQIASENGQFTMNEVVASITEKMIRRHPHVFGDVSVENSSQVLDNWEKIKQGEKDGGNRVKSILDDIPRGLPALLRASKVQKKAARVGFDWPDYQGPLHKIKEEQQELLDAYRSNDRHRIQDELGDLLFAVVNLSRFFDVDAEVALSSTIEKFIRRFQFVEHSVKNLGKKMEDCSLEELDNLWEKAKKQKFRETCEEKFSY